LIRGAFAEDDRLGGTLGLEPPRLLFHDRDDHAPTETPRDGEGSFGHGIEQALPPNRAAGADVQESHSGDRPELPGGRLHDPRERVVRCLPALGLVDPSSATLKAFDEAGNRHGSRCRSRQGLHSGVDRQSQLHGKTGGRAFIFRRDVGGGPAVF
jgi:hypothetical protein